MSVTIVISFPVEEFDRWKDVFDSDSDNREAAGIHATAYKEQDDGNSVHVIGTAPSKDAFLTFFSNPDLQQRIHNSGVTGPPEIKILEKG